jgi:hypothetical protein
VEEDLLSRDEDEVGSHVIFVQLRVVLHLVLGHTRADVLDEYPCERCKEEDEEATVKILCDCMLEACHRVLGKELDIRNDVDIHRHDEVWIEDKGRKKKKNLPGKFLSISEKPYHDHAG